MASAGGLVASEWALLRALAAVDVLGPKPGESWSKTVEKIAAALDAARAEGENAAVTTAADVFSSDVAQAYERGFKAGAERERWECFRIACVRPMECGGDRGGRHEESNWTDRLKHHKHYDCLQALDIADDISDRGPARLTARGPMRGPEEE